MPFYLKFFVSILFFASPLLLSSTRQKDNGKLLFNRYCKSCHNPNSNSTAPAFQKIRNDYGIDWTIKFIRDNQLMLQQRDSKALYIYYTYSKTLQNKFTNLTKSQIIEILDYVDSFPIDTSLYSHRKISNRERQNFIHAYEEKERRQVHD